MADLLKIYRLAVGRDSDDVLEKPGVKYVADLLSQCGASVSEDDLQNMLDSQEWSGEVSFTSTEVQELGEMFKDQRWIRGVVKYHVKGDVIRIERMRDSKPGVAVDKLYICQMA